MTTKIADDVDGIRAAMLRIHEDENPLTVVPSVFGCTCTPERWDPDCPLFPLFPKSSVRGNVLTYPAEQARIERMAKAAYTAIAEFWGLPGRYVWEEAGKVQESWRLAIRAALEADKQP